ncbi:MAG: hypothetical protein WCI96_11575, partial [Planctomycetota bacterium]
MIEPMLRGPSGHYAEFVRALASRCDGVFESIEVVGGARAAEFLASLGGASRGGQSIGGASMGGAVSVRAEPLPRGPAAELRAMRASLGAGRQTLVLTAGASHAILGETAAFLDA